jgi:hypothetical protein
MIEIVDSFEGDKVGLFKDMINYKNPYISIIFIKSAGNYMDALLGEEISKYIKDEDINKKIAAIKALGQAGDVRYIDEIIECIEDSSWEVRAASAKSLGRLGNGSALKYLSGALTDSQWWVRHNAASALIELPGSMGTIEEVLKGKDRSKDAVVSAVESSGLLENMKSKEMQHDSDAKRMIEAIKEYHIQRQS